MAILTAYFDESGTHDTAPIMCVAGYIAPVEDWLEFEREWMRELAHWGLEYFHMHKYAHSLLHFERFRKHEQQRREIISRFTGIIKRRVSHGFAVWAKASDYESLTSERWRQTFGSTYTICTRLCVDLVSSWAATNLSPESRISYVFAGGALHESEAERFMAWTVTNETLKSRSRYRAHSFADMKETTPLQAADILAYEAYRDFQRVLGNAPDWKARWPLRNLLQSPHTAMHMDRNKMVQVLKAIGGMIEKATELVEGGLAPTEAMRATLKEAEEEYKRKP